MNMDGSCWRNRVFYGLGLLPSLPAGLSESTMQLFVLSWFKQVESPENLEVMALSVSYQSLVSGNRFIC